MTAKQRHSTIIFSLVGIIFLCSPQSQAGWLFTKVADTSTAIPGGTGDFTSLGLPAINGDFITFDGSGTLGSDGLNQQGIYIWSLSGGLQRVTDNGPLTPFGSFSPPTVDSNGTTSFQTDTPGIFTGQGGASSVTPVATASSTVPGFPGGSFFFGTPDPRPASIDSGVVAFSAFSRGNGLTNEGVYTVSSSGGAITRVADQTTNLPYGNGTVQMPFILAPAINHGQVVFTANGGGPGGQDSGVYALINGSIVRVIDSTQTIPGTTDKFTLEEGPSVTPMAIANGRVAFLAGNHGYYGMTQNGTIVPLATFTNTPPGSSQPFIFVNGLGLNANGSYVFEGQTLGGEAIYYSPSFTSGDYSRVIGDGDLLDGKTILSVSEYPFSLSGNEIVFNVSFTDGSQAVFEGTLTGQSVPEPSSLLLLGVGLLAIAGYRRRTARAN